MVCAKNESRENYFFLTEPETSNIKHPTPNIERKNLMVFMFPMHAKNRKGGFQ